MTLVSLNRVAFNVDWPNTAADDMKSIVHTMLAKGLLINDR